MLDNSGTMEYSFTIARKFVKKITELFKLSRKGTRASVITISGKRHTNLAIRFSDYYSTSQFAQAVDDIRVASGKTRIDLALKIASSEAFKVSNGARPGVPKLVFFVSDGRQEPDFILGYRGLWRHSIPLHRITRNVVSIAVTGLRPIDIGALQLISRNRDNCYNPGNLSLVASNSFVHHIFNKFCSVT